MSDKQVIIDASIDKIIPHFNAANIFGKNLFITGGTGFFGFWLLSTIAILNRNHADIRVTALSREPQRFFAACPHLCNCKWLSVVQGDVKDFCLPPARYDLLLHAATDTPAAAHKQPLRIFDEIVVGSRRILDFAINSGVSRVLLVSSGAVYGGAAPGTIQIAEAANTACRTDAPASAYGEGKRFMEMLGTLYAQSYGLDVVSARCFAFVGPRLPLDAHFAIGNFIRDALRAEIITVRSDGTPLRSYLYGGDLAVWLLTLLANDNAMGIYNVGSDQSISMRQMATLVRDVLSPAKEVVVLGQPGESTGRDIYVPSVQRARREFGLDVWTSLEDAVRLTAAVADD